MQADASLPHRTAIIDELERSVRLYLDDTFGGAEAGSGASAIAKTRNRS